MVALTFYEKIHMMFKKQSLFIAFILLIVASACAQTTKKMVFDGAAEDRNLSGFTSIKVTNAFDVYISQGNQDAVAVPDKLILEAPLAPTFRLLTFTGPLISLAPEILTTNLSDVIGSTKETLQAPETDNFSRFFTVI